MDLKGTKSSREDESSGSGDIEGKKACTDCKTTKTPLWRGGPAGPKSLCNACGIRYRKKRSVMRLEKGPEKKREKNYHQQHHYCHRHFHYHYSHNNKHCSGC